MAIQYMCEGCGASMTIKEKLAGTKGKCPKCQAEFTVPVTEESIEQFLSDGPDLPKPSQPMFPPPDEAEEFRKSASPQPSAATDDDENDADDEDEQARTASETADTLMALAKAKTKSDRAERKQAEKAAAAAGAPIPKSKPKPSRDSRSEYDLGETLMVYGKMALPAALGILVVAPLLYWLSSQMFSDVDYPDLGRVTGTVTLDGAPLVNAVVTFRPDFGGMEAGTRIASSVGRTDANGRYTLEYVRDVPGAAVGTHRVEILDSEGLLPAEYHQPQMTILSAEVTPGSNTIDFPLKSTPDR